MALSLATLSLPPTLKFSSSLSSSNSSFFINTGSEIFRPACSTSRLALTKPHPKNGRKKGFCCTCLFGLGVPELVVIAGVAALVFGPKKLPEVGKSIGKTVKSFQQAAKEFESELKKDPESTTEATESKPTPVSADIKEDNKVTAANEGS